jgi:hypothetical protein
MNTFTVVDDGSQAEPLDETVYPRRRSKAPGAGATAQLAPPRAARAQRAPDAPGPRVDVPPPSQELDATIAPRKAAASAASRGDWLLYLLLFSLIAAAWQISQLRLFKPTDDVGYWIGVVGGSLMLALFTYPMRKYLRFMQNWGQVKAWFWFHLGLGIGGPWLILVHSQFRIGSLNAGVALYSMAVVVASGVVGRFIHVRIHRGLNGERTSLRELRERAGLVEDNARSRLHFCPAVEERLLAFEQRELHSQPGWATHLRQVTLLPLQQWLTYLRCVRDLRKPLHQLAGQYQWSASELRRRKRRARRLVDHYLNAVVRVAQYGAYERVFALWHLAHLPFVYLLVISAVVHVIAVHAY